jgi:hypothetical protein
VVTADDFGLPFPVASRPNHYGLELNLNLAKGLTVSTDGLSIPHVTGTKIFEPRVPVSQTYRISPLRFMRAGDHSAGVYKCAPMNFYFG